jgi:hypothetical protein
LSITKPFGEVTRVRFGSEAAHSPKQARSAEAGVIWENEGRKETFRVGAYPSEPLNGLLCEEPLRLSMAKITSALNI